MTAPKYPDAPSFATANLQLSELISALSHALDITEGQPVGSRALSRFSGLDLSPATVRNVMADLEEAGFIASPHTSAGRIPTARGYRFFVDSLLTVCPLERARIDEMEDLLQSPQPQQQLWADVAYSIET